MIAHRTDTVDHPSYDDPEAVPQKERAADWAEYIAGIEYEVLWAPAWPHYNDLITSEEKKAYRDQWSKAKPKSLLSTQTKAATLIVE